MELVLDAELYDESDTSDNIITSQQSQELNFVGAVCHFAGSGCLSFERWIGCRHGRFGGQHPGLVGTPPPPAPWFGAQQTPSDAQ